MRALSLVGVGLLVVAVDLRIEGFDLVADPVGWGFVVAVLARVRARHPSFGTARTAAVVALALSALQVVLGYLDPRAAAWGSVAEGLVDLAVVVPLCTGIAAAVAERDPGRARSAGTIRTIDIVLTVLVTPVVAWSALAAEPDGTSVSLGGGLVAVLLLGVVVAGLAVRLWLVILLFQVAAEVEGDARSLADPDGAQPLVP